MKGLLLVFSVLYTCIVTLLLFVYTGNFTYFTLEAASSSQFSDEIQRIASIDNFYSVNAFKKTEIPLSNSLEIQSELPAFITTKNGILLVTPKKSDIGIHRLDTFDSNTNALVRIYIEVISEKIDTAALHSEISEYLGSRVEQYGIYIYDIQRDQEIALNENEVFSPASIAKITIAALILRDVDSGKIALSDTVPISSNYKFTGTDDLGNVADRTLITIEEYLLRMITESSNTAWYHLHGGVLGGAGVVNSRTIDELGVNPLFLDPHISTARNIGKVLFDAYTGETLSEESSNYFISLMEQAVPDLKNGIGRGLPIDTRFANKIGFLDTPDDLSYQDAAIVWGEKSDYIIVILNKETSWHTGLNDLENISRIVYEFLNK